MRSTGTEPVFNIRAYIEPPGTIVLEERDNIIHRVIQQKMDTTDKLVQAKLIELGWIHKSMISDAARRAQGDGWIPVSERLPSVAQEVIVNSEFDGVTAGFLDSYGEWYAPNSDYKLTRVVAWQPLPAAPDLHELHAAKNEAGKAEVF